MKGKVILTVAEAENREKWLAIRRQGVGGSDAAVIVGKSKWKSPYQLWLDKTGKVEPDDLSDNEAVYWGTVLEDIVAKRFEEMASAKANEERNKIIEYNQSPHTLTPAPVPDEKFVKVRRCGTLQDEEFPFMLANVDRLVVGEEAGLEIKTANGFKAKEWEGDEVPDAYYLQCQWYMGITGFPKWYIACLIGGQRFVWKEIPRNEDDIQALRKAAQLFWEINVQRDVPPELDGSEGTTEALGAMYDKPSDNSMVTLPSAAQAAIETLDQLTLTEKIIAEQKAQAQNTLKALLGNFETGIIGERKVTWKMTKGRTTVDSKKLQAEYPEAYAACTKIGKGSRTFKLY